MRKMNLMIARKIKNLTTWSRWEKSWFYILDIGNQIMKQVKMFTLQSE